MAARGGEMAQRFFARCRARLRTAHRWRLPHRKLRRRELSPPRTRGPSPSAFSWFTLLFHPEEGRFDRVGLAEPEALSLVVVDELCKELEPCAIVASRHRVALRK